MAAFSLHHSLTPLGNYLRRMKAKLGPEAATMATAHKIAVIFYTIVKNQVEYDETLWATRDAQREKGWKQNSNHKPNNWATNSSLSNSRLRNEPVQRAGIPWKQFVDQCEPIICRPLRISSGRRKAGRQRGKEEKTSPTPLSSDYGIRQRNRRKQ